MDNLLHQLAYVGAIAVLVLMCIGLACIAFAPRPPRLEDDQATPETPYLPPPVIVHLSLGDRLAQDTRAEIERRHAEWVAWAAREESIQRIERGEYDQA